MGDFNARTTNNQAIQLDSREGAEDNPICLEENGDHMWERILEDGQGIVSHFGVELLGACSLHGLIIFNGIEKWLSSRGITCKTYNGHSVVDYILCS